MNISKFNFVHLGYKNYRLDDLVFMLQAFCFPLSSVAKEDKELQKLCKGTFACSIFAALKNVSVILSVNSMD